MQLMVLSVIGEDKPGLIDELATAIRSVNGNWLKSSFCQLGGHFAGFVEVSLATDAQQSLMQACQSMTSLNVQLKTAITSFDNSGQIHTIKVTGNDRNGIVNDVSGVLTNLNVNIAQLDTACSNAPNWGSSMFTASFKIQTNTDLDDIKTAIEAIADDLIVDVDDLSN